MDYVFKNMNTKSFRLVFKNMNTKSFIAIFFICAIHVREKISDLTK